MAMLALRSFLPVRWLLAMVLLSVSVAAIAADTKPPRRSRTQEPAPLTGEAYDLVFLGPEGAVIFRLMIDTGKRTITDTRRDYAAVVFRSLDADASMSLEPAEAMKIPQNGQLSANTPTVGDGWKAIDNNPADEKINADELFAYVDRQLGPRLRVALRTRLQQTVRLNRPLDTDSDEHVSRTELETGLEILRSNDFDDDGTLSVAELQPYPTAMRQAMQRQEAEAAGDVPLALLNSESDRVQACERLLNCYGAADVSTAERRIPCERIGGLSADLVKSHDADADGMLNGTELAALLASSAPRLTMGAQVNRNAVQDPDARIDNLVAHLTPTRKLSEGLLFRLAGMPVTVKSSSNKYAGMSDPELIVNQALVRFIEIDADKNRYLDATEFMNMRARLPELDLPDVEYAGVDADGNGMLTQAELRAYAQTNVGLSESALVVTVSDDAKTLFEILDGNLDNRLSPREFREGATRMKKYDHDKDGRFGMNEMRTEYGFVISRARPQFVTTVRPNAAAMAAAGVPRPTASTAGPTWFQKMDRNRDGDVAWREFLGTRADFDRLDGDHNALIDINEATVAE
jgi:Ca2+-binding EF-hand superfamily protein